MKTFSIQDYYSIGGKEKALEVSPMLWLILLGIRIFIFSFFFSFIKINSTNNIMQILLILSSVESTFKHFPQKEIIHRLHIFLSFFLDN